MIFFFVDDDYFCIVTNVDDIVYVAVGIVKRVAKLLMVLCSEIDISLLILNLLRVVVQVDGDRDSWRRWRNFAADCYYFARFCIRKEIIVIGAF